MHKRSLLKLSKEAAHIINKDRKCLRNFQTASHYGAESIINKPRFLFCICSLEIWDLLLSHRTQIGFTKLDNGTVDTSVFNKTGIVMRFSRERLGFDFDKHASTYFLTTI